MLRRTVSGVMLSLMIISTITFAFNVQQVKAEGTIYIRADGSVDPSTVPILNVGSVYYTFRADIFGSIVVERDNIVLDGADYLLHGSGSGTGITLSGRSNVTVRNTRITFHYRGILLSLSPNNQLLDNAITENFYGVWAVYSDGISLIGNEIVNNSRAGYFGDANNNIFKGNTISLNGLFEFEGCSNNVFTNNVIHSNGDSAIYFFGSTYVGPCNNNTLTNNTVSNNRVGIEFLGYEYRTPCDDNILTENIFLNNQYGISLGRNSHRNEIYHNNFVNNTYQVYFSGESANVWDDGYPSGGNYWSDYTDVDLYSGLYQNETGSDCIWDHPYIIDSNNQDSYPLVNPWTPTPPWPMFMHDLKHTSVSPYRGPQTNETSWIISIPDTGILTNSPVIGSDGTIYIGGYVSGKSKFYAINPNGTVQWVFDQFGTQAISGIPAIGKDGAIYFATSGGVNYNGRLHCLNPDGTLRWLSGDPALSHFYLVDTGLAIGIDQTIYIAACVEERLIAVNPNGTVKWIKQLGARTWSSPAIADDGTIYVAQDLHKLFAFNPDGSELWSLTLRSDLGAIYMQSPAIGEDGTIYLAGYDKLYAVTPNGEIKWTVNTPIEGQIFEYSSPAIGENGMIYVAVTGGGEKAQFCAINPNGTFGWIFNTDDDTYIYSSPAIGNDGTIYFGSYGGNVYALSSDGSLKWRYETGRQVACSPAIGLNGLLIIADRSSNGGNLYAFGQTLPPPDITPPALIEDFTASDGEDKRSILHWTNPSDSDLAEVVVLRKTEEYPDSHSDGEFVYRSTPPSPSAQVEFIDTALVNGRVYGYAVFGRDSAGNWNDEVKEGKNADMASPFDSTNEPPTASFVYSPDKPKVGKPIDFASSSTDDGEIILYEWDWNGDGTYDWSTSDPQVTFIYEKSGTFQVGLRVTDDEGATQTATRQVIVAEWSFWEKVRGNHPWSDRVRQLTQEEYQYIKSKLYVFTFADLAQYESFHDYYDTEDESTGSALYWYTDWDLMDALNMEMDPGKSPGLTYGIYLLDALREMEKVELTWTQGYKIKASKYFSDLLEANTKWTSERATEELADAMIEVLKQMVSPYTKAVNVGVSIAQLVKDCLKYSIPIARLMNLLYYNSLWRYLDCRYGGMDHTAAWEELILYPTQDYHIPTDDPEKLVVIEDYFERLYDKYGSHLNDLGAFQREVKKDLRILVLNVLKAAHPVGHVIITPHSPVEVRVYDPYGNVTGMIDGQLREGIFRSACDNETGMIFIYSAPNGCYYEVVGKSDGIYGLDITNVENGNFTLFAATDIPITSEAIHQYAIDWDALSQGGEGVTVQVDSDGDNVFEHTFTSDSELTRDEFIQQTTPTYTLTITATVGGTTNPSPGTYTYTANSSVQVTAIPNADYVFDHWELDTVNVGSTNPYTVVMDGNHTLKAVRIYSPPPPPLSVSISPLSASILVGQSVTFTSTVSGGYIPYTYQWYLNSAPVSSATSNTWTFTPTTGGIYYVYLKVTDAKGNTAQSETARIAVAAVPVGGYSISIQLPSTAKPVTIHIALLTILTALSITVKRKTKRKT